MTESALLIFTFLMNIAIGLVICSTLMKVKYPKLNLKYAYYVAACFSIIAVIASLLHLGKPFSALNSILNLGDSWLSREILFSGAFAGIVVVYACIELFKSSLTQLKNILSWLGSIVGLIAVFTMGKLYATSAVVAWDSVNTFIEFYATVFSAGFLMFLLICYKEVKDLNLNFIKIPAMIAVAIQVATFGVYGMNLVTAGGNVVDSVAILIDYQWMMFLKWFLIVVGMFIITLQIKSLNIKASIYVATTLLVVGQFLGRYLFYLNLVIPVIG